MEGSAAYPKEYRPLGRHLIWRGDLVVYGGGGIASANGLGLPPGLAEIVGLGATALAFLVPVPASRPVRLALFGLLALVGLALAIKFSFRLGWPLMLFFVALVRLGHEGLIGPTRFGRFLTRPLGRRSEPTP